MNEKLNQFWSNKPLIISGPCSAETENQVLNTAIELAKNKSVGLLRAGVWKPRTKPGQFEGVGEIALNWLENARNQTGLPFAVEVAQGVSCGEGAGKEHRCIMDRGKKHCKSIFSSGNRLIA